MSSPVLDNEEELNDLLNILVETNSTNNVNELRRRRDAFVRIQQILGDGVWIPSSPLSKPKKTIPKKTIPKKTMPTTPTTLAGDKRLSELAPLMDKFNEILDNTQELLNECFRENSTTTNTSNAVANNRRSRIKIILDEAEENRQAFINQYEKASKNVQETLPNIERFRNQESNVQAKIRNACAIDDQETVIKKQLETAKRCDPTSPDIPKSVRNFVSGTGNYAKYIDRRIYCFTGDDEMNFPGSEIGSPMTPVPEVLPPVGAYIGPQDYQVVIKEGRFFGVGYLDTDNKRKERVAANIALVASGIRQIIGKIANMITIAQNTVITAINATYVSSVYKTAIITLIEQISKAQHWIVTTSTYYFGERGARAIFGSLVNSGAYSMSRIIATFGNAFIDESLRKYMFLLIVASAIVAYKKSRDAKNDSWFSNSYVRSAIITAAITFLTTTVQYQTIVTESNDSFESDVNSPTNNDDFKPFPGGDHTLIWPLGPDVPFTTTTTTTPPPPIILSRETKKTLDSLERELFPPPLMTTLPIDSLSDATVLVNGAITSEVLTRITSDTSIMDKLTNLVQDEADSLAWSTMIGIAIGTVSAPLSIPAMTIFMTAAGTKSAVKIGTKLAIDYYFGDKIQLTERGLELVSTTSTASEIIDTANPQSLSQRIIDFIASTSSSSSSSTAIQTNTNNIAQYMTDW